MTTTMNHIQPGMFSVPSKTSDQNYKVDIINKTCDCPSYLYGNDTIMSTTPDLPFVCKHIEKLLKRNELLLKIKKACDAKDLPRDMFETILKKAIYDEENPPDTRRFCAGFTKRGERCSGCARPGEPKSYPYNWEPIFKAMWYRYNPKFCCRHQPKDYPHRGQSVSQDTQPTQWFRADRHDLEAVL